jgi:iron(III) transport system permease protein
MDVIQDKLLVKKTNSVIYIFLPILGIIAYLGLPWFGLEYGLTESTWDEILEGFAWHNVNIAILPLISCILFLLHPWRFLPETKRLIIDVSLAAGTILFIIIAALIQKQSLGLGAGIQLIALCLIFSSTCSMMGFLRGDGFLSGAIMMIVLMVLLFIIYPLGRIFLQVFYARTGEFIPFQFFEIITSFGVGRVLWNTLMMAFSVGVSTTFFGLVFAIYSVRSTSRLRGLIKVFYILPIITPPFVVGLSLILIFGRSGSINDILLFFIGPEGIFTPEGGQGIFKRSSYIYGFPGIFLAQTLALTPVSYMMLVGMVSAINPALEEASLTMRASRWQTFKRVTLPLIRPGIANSFLLGVISSAADFGNPLVLGGEYDVLSTEIYFSIAGAQLDFARAATLGSLLFGISLFVYYLQKNGSGSILM